MALECSCDGELVLMGELGVFTELRRYAAAYAEELCRLCAVSAKSMKDCKEPSFQAAMEGLLRKHWVDLYCLSMRSLRM